MLGAQPMLTSVGGAVEVEVAAATVESAVEKLSIAVLASRIPAP